MPELVRVKDKKTGHEFSWPADLVEGVEGVEVIDKPAVDANGEPIPAKHKTSVKEAAASKSTAVDSTKK
jgi:hypothetical protein